MKQILKSIFGLNVATVSQNDSGYINLENNGKLLVKSTAQPKKPADFNDVFRNVSVSLKYAAVKR